MKTFEPCSECNGEMPMCMRNGRCAHAEPLTPGPFVIAMQAIVGTIVAVGWFLMWVAGCVMAKGFWSTLFAICTGGFWSAYLLVEKLLQVIGWV